jgi:hypothetical protein
MSRTSSDGSDAGVALTLEIIEALESCGLSEREYQLYEYVDVDALARLLDAADDLEVQVSVEGIPLRVTEEGVTVITEDPAAATA